MKPTCVRQQKNILVSGESSETISKTKMIQARASLFLRSTLHVTLHMVHVLKSVCFKKRTVRKTNSICLFVLYLLKSTAPLCAYRHGKSTRFGLESNLLVLLMAGTYKAIRSENKNIMWSGQIRDERHSEIFNTHLPALSAKNYRESKTSHFLTVDLSTLTRRKVPV